LVEWASKIAILVGILGISKYVEDNLRSEIKNNFGKWLINVSFLKTKEKISQLNQLFIKVFDFLFGTRYPKIEIIIWNLLLISIFYSLIYGFLSNFFPKFGLSYQALLPMALTLSILLFGILIKFSRARPIFAILAIISLFLFNIFTIIVEYFYQILAPQNAGTISINNFHQFLRFIEVQKYNISSSTLMLLALLLLSILLKNHKFTSFIYSISPLKSFTSSIIAIMICIGLLQSVLESADVPIGTILLSSISYIALNLVIDTTSLVETRFILQFVHDRPVYFSIIILLFDLVLTGFIYLLIPLVSGNSQIFFEAILLKGDAPWLAVFFWSTFGTSLIYYLFCISSIILSLLLLLGKIFNVLNKLIKVQEQPIMSIGFTMAIVVFLLFLIL